jgi:putative zinc finger/helix-turn-helix YgiT family protein
MTTVCPICDKGQLIERFRSRSFEYDGVTLSINKYYYSHCDQCEEDIVLPAQARNNELQKVDARRKHDNLLTSAEIKRVRERWSLTQQAASAAFGGGANAFSKYERGEVTQSKSMDLLIRAADQIEDLRTFLARNSGVCFAKSEVVKVSIKKAPIWHSTAEQTEPRAYSVDDINELFGHLIAMPQERVSSPETSAKHHSPRADKQKSDWVTEEHGRFEYAH